jgi:hypothetical protein
LILSRFLPVEIIDTIRTGHLAIAAPNASIKICQDEAIISLKPGPYGTHLNARCIITVHTWPGEEQPVHTGILAILQPEDIHP